MTTATTASHVTIRPARDTDAHQVHAVVAAAFGQATEASLVEELRDCGALVLELVAEDEHGTLVGHIAISRVTGTGRGHRLAISCLAPLSVLPAYQRTGIGAALTNAAIADLGRRGEDLLLVLGDPNYYPRFGFDPELARKVEGPYAGAAFMAMALSEAGRRDLPVEVTFATPFQAFE